MFAALHTDSSGLTSDEAQQRLRAIGSNTIVDEPAANIARLALRQLASPLVLILVFGGAVSALLREWVEAAIILAVLLGSTALGFVQEYRASTSVAMLRRRLALTVKVRRDGEVAHVQACLRIDFAQPLDQPGGEPRGVGVLAAGARIDLQDVHRGLREVVDPTIPIYLLPPSAGRS